MTEKVYPAPTEYAVFKAEINRLTGIDLDMYKYQIHRRVHMLMQLWEVTDYSEYFRIICTDPERKREFLDYITINVSEFFRNPLRWWVLRDELIPRLISDRGQKSLNFWSAGCATGEEPYSLAILSKEMGLGSRKVLAMEIDQGALGRARKGVYAEKQLGNMPADWKERYFRSLGDGKVEVNSEIRNRVEFREGNLLKDVFPEGMDLILCRNVVIYFSGVTKNILYRKFFESLAPGGYLMVGATEQIFGYREIGFESAGAFLYRKPAGTTVSSGKSLAMTR